jgi:hypothetical protein
MAQILDPINDNANESIFCCYVNATSQIQVARITNVSNWYFERVVFPGQRLVFEAFLEGLLEIHTGMMTSAILSDTIPCKRLLVKEDNHQRNDDEGISSRINRGSYKENRQKNKYSELAIASIG